MTVAAVSFIITHLPSAAVLSARRPLLLLACLVLAAGWGTVHAQTVQMTPILGLLIGEAVEPPTGVTTETLVETVLRPAAGFGVRVRPWGEVPLVFGLSGVFAQGTAQSISVREAGFRHRKEMLSFAADLGVFYEFSVDPVDVTVGGVAGPEVLEVEDSTEHPLAPLFFRKETEWKVSGGPVVEVAMTITPGLRAALALSYRLNRPSYSFERQPAFPGAETGTAQLRLRAFTPQVVVLVAI